MRLQVFVFLATLLATLVLAAPAPAPAPQVRCDLQNCDLRGCTDELYESQDCPSSGSNVNNGGSQVNQAGGDQDVLLSSSKVCILRVSCLSASCMGGSDADGWTGAEINSARKKARLVVQQKHRRRPGQSGFWRSDGPAVQQHDQAAQSRRVLSVLPIDHQRYCHERDDRNLPGLCPRFDRTCGSSSRDSRQRAEGRCPRSSDLHQA